MKQLRRIFSFSLAVLLLLGLSTTAMASNYESVSLTGDGAIAGQTNFQTEASFHVDMGTGFTDNLVLYKIADAEYEENSSTVKVSWTPAPADKEDAKWIADLATDGILANYPSPNVLGTATTAEQKRLLTEIAKYIDAGVKAEDESESVSDATAVKKALVEDQTTFTETLNASGVYDFTDIPVGMYLAYSVDEGTYIPLSINVVPQKQDDGTWVISNQDFRRKFTSVDLAKTIDKDQVSVGDVVEFTITAGVPQYTEGMQTADKFFTIDDDMSTAFSYNKGTMKVEYISSNGVSVQVPQTDGSSKTIYTPVVSSDVTVYSCPTADHQYFNIYEVVENDTYYYYYLEENVMHALYSTAEKNDSTLTYSGPVFTAYQALTGDTISHGLSPMNLKKNLFNVNFNYDNLSAWMEEKSYTGGSIKITYEATVTDSIQVNSDSNYNTAILLYAKDENGTVERLEDTVRAYTYGINIVKVNGDTLSNGQVTQGTEYLAGAQFNLYKLARTEPYAVVLDAQGTATDGADMASYNEMLAKIQANSQVPYPLPTSVTVEGEEGQEGQTTIQYYLYGEIKGNIETVATAGGVQVKGLGPGTYLLIETLAPSGYNKLNQGLRFTIREDTTEGEKGKRGSLTSLVDANGTPHTNGYMDLLVSNFKGLTLPETGGEGTLLFTVFGMTMMTAAMFVLVMKKRRMA